MRVLITGISGFVGSHLADYIIDNHPEHEVFGFKRWQSPMDNIAHHPLDKLTLYDGDLRDLSSVIFMLDKVKPDIIFHLAADKSYALPSYMAPADTIHSNVIGTVNLLEAVRFIKLDPFIHICSSSEVYGQVDESEIPIKETAPLRPPNPYAVSKAAEDLLGWQYFISYGMRIVRTRAFTQSGPRRRDTFAESSFAKQIASIEIGKQNPVIKVGNLGSVRNFTDVRDMVRAYWMLVQGLIAGTIPSGEVYNIGTWPKYRGTMRVGEVLEHLLGIAQPWARSNIKVEVDEAKLRPADIQLQIPDITKFEDATGWKPEIPFEKTMGDLLEYWRGKVGK